MNTPPGKSPSSISSAKTLLDILLKIQSNMGQGVAITRGPRTLFVNDVFCTMTGYTLEELTSRSWLELVIAPEERAWIADRYRRRLAGEPVESRYETTILHKTGRRIDIEIAVSLIDPPGPDARVAVIGRDVTDRNRMAESLFESEERFRTLAESINAAVFIEERGRLIYVNPATEALTGYTRQELMAMEHPEGVIDPECLREHETALYRVDNGPPEPFKLELKIRTKAGDERWIEVDGAPITVADRRVTVGAAFDITDRKRFEETLRRSEERYRSLVRGAVYGIYRTSVDGRFTDVNPALVRMMGYDSEAALLEADLVRDIYVDPSEREKMIQQITAAQEVIEIQTRARRKDGRIIVVHVSGRILRGADGSVEGFEGIVQDVTQKLALEEQVRHAQKMEAVGRLAAGIAHDFNNLLTVIGGYSELVMATFEPGDERRADVEQISAAARRAASLTRQLLALGRRQPRQLQLLDVGSIVANLDQILRRLLGDEIELVIQCPSAAVVEADSTQIEQAIINLVANARDAMPTGGRLTISVDEARVDAQGAGAAGMPAGVYVRLTVADTGSGMDAETRARMFEPFFTTKDVGQGSGLGLSTVYGIVDQSGGHIRVESQLGRGSTFAIYLPKVLEASPDIGPIPTGDVAALTGTETILLVEDEEMVRGIVQQMLERQGYHVLAASSGLEALEIARQTRGLIHLLLTDVVMPGMNGVTLVDRLRDTRPETRPLIMTGFADQSILQRAARPELPLIHKPFTTDALARKVRETLD